MKMNKEEFMKFVEKNIQYHLPESMSFQVEVGNKMELSVFEANSQNAMRIQLEEAYEDFMQGTSMFYIMENIADSVVITLTLSANMEQEKEEVITYANNYSEAKKRLQIIVSDPDIREVPEDSVVTKVGAYDAQYKILLDTTKGEKPVRLNVTENLLKRWNITKEQLHQDALEVKEKWNEPVLKNSVEVLQHALFDFPEPENLLENVGEKIDLNSLYVLTNENAKNGASMLAHSEVLEKIGNLLSDQDYYIFPSSIDELLILPDTHLMSVKEMQEMVHSINITELDTEDRLSDKVLYYNFKERKLELASDQEKNFTQQMESEKQEDFSKRTEKQTKKTKDVTPRM